MQCIFVKPPGAECAPVAIAKNAIDKFTLPGAAF
jgi:hypothetical protein